MRWTYDRSPKALVSIESKRRVLEERMEQPLDVDAAHAVNIDVQAFAYLMSKLRELEIAGRNPAKDPEAGKILHQHGQAVHIRFRVKPYTAFLRVDTPAQTAILVEFRHDGDRHPLFRPTDEPRDDIP